MPNSLSETPIEQARRIIRLVPIIVSVEAVIAIVAFVALFALFQANAQAAKMAPDFTLTLYPGYDGGYGQQITLGALRGKVVLLHFSITIPAVDFKEETRQLEQLWRKYKDQGLVVLGIFSHEAEPDVIKYLTELGVTYPNGSDPESAIQSQYDVRSVPATVIIARNGELVYQGVGAQKRDKIDQVLSPLLTR